MDTKQKQRIFGIVFLVLLAVVAIPAFLKRSENSEPIAPTMDAVSPTPDEASTSPTPQPTTLPAPEQVTPAPTSESIAPNEQGQNPTQGQIPPQTQIVPTAPINPQPSVEQPATPAMPTQGAVGQGQIQEPMPAETPQPMPPQENATSMVAPSPAPPAVPEDTAAATPSLPHETEVAPAKKPSVTKPHVKETHAEKLNWTIRLALFSVRANADKLTNSLKKHGYAPHVEEIKTYKGMTYKVFLKTKSTRADIDKLAEKLNKQFRLHVMVARQH